MAKIHQPSLSSTTNEPLKLYLAPMEGVLDSHLRGLLTAQGGIDECTTEFLRINRHQRLPRRVFLRICPELTQGGTTPAGVPVRLQLLGGDPDSMAWNAAKAASIGAKALDLNFGCPAKTVNKSDGGASLLKEPERLYRIVAAVRTALPKDVSLTAKIRLGFASRSGFLETAAAAESGGAERLTVHARSKVDGYRPPAYWEHIEDIRQAITIPVTANGEIWSPEDFDRCRAVSGCNSFMLGRGMLARPDLALTIAHKEASERLSPLSWDKVQEMLWQYHSATAPLYPGKHQGCRIKQWLIYLRRQYAQAATMFERIKGARGAEEFERTFATQCGKSVAESPD